MYTEIIIIMKLESPIYGLAKFGTQTSKFCMHIWSGNPEDWV